MTGGINVRDALAMRTTLAEHLTEPWYIRRILGHYSTSLTEAYEVGDPDGITLRTRHPEQRADAYPEWLAQKFAASLRIGEVYAISADMLTFAQQAGEDLPHDFVVEPHHLHAQHGFLVLPRPIRDKMAGEEVSAKIHALTWHHGTGSTYRDEAGVVQAHSRKASGVEINLWGWWEDEETGRRFLGPVGSDFQPYGLPTLGYQGEGHLDPASRLVFALQMLMRQELPALTRHPIPKADLRSLRRLDLPGSSLTVIELRRRAPSKETGTSGRHLTHRHYVRSTWAAYWVGPSHPQHPGGTEEKVRIYLYRVAHIRGPEDAPFAPTPARVHAIRR